MAAEVKRGGLHGYQVPEALDLDDEVRAGVPQHKVRAACRLAGLNAELVDTEHARQDRRHLPDHCAFNRTGTTSHDVNIRHVDK
jgi:hypothetical protein